VDIIFFMQLSPQKLWSEKDKNDPQIPEDKKGI
jgi:hypothetical protein